MVYTSERQAYRNLARRYNYQIDWFKNLDQIDWHWVAVDQNPLREWIGAQIRIDSYAYAVPGWPEKAAEMAFNDARVSHVKNGIYGAMYCAAMIAAAFATDDPVKVVEIGLSEIPRTSRLHAEMRQVVEICRRHGMRASAFEAVLDEVWSLLGHYDPVHTNNNAGLVTAALLLGQHEYEKAITIAVMGGWDTDCNGATVGSIVGAMLGAKPLPAKWIAPLHDTLNSQVLGYHPIAISECARRGVAIARKAMG
jgi:ADP-ribosylglycohydrolase